MATILISTPAIDAALQALHGHELRSGVPGGDAAAQALICDPTQPVDAAALARMPQLAAIAVAGAGSDAIDAAAAGERGIRIITAGEALVQTTADLAFALILAAARQLPAAERRLREGAWTGWSFIEQEFGRDVWGARLGLVGYGRIGRAVAARAQGFQMRVRHHTRTPTGEEGWTGDLDELLRASEIVSVHVPLDDTTRGLIDERRIGLLSREAVLVNTARGAVVDEEALARALVAGRLYAAGIDVYAAEPTVSPRLLAAPRAVLLPHVGSATAATRTAMLRLAAERLAAFLAGAGQA